MYLPYAFSSIDRHRLVHFVEPERIDWRHGFFERGRPGQRPDDAIMPLERWLADTGLPPNFSVTSGIFHVSRCGSTLLAQNLKATGQAIVLGEPPFMRILRTRLQGSLSLADAAMAVSRVIGCWQGWAASRGKRLVIKFNSQAHKWREAILAALPGARFVFLHREPIAVFESISRKPPRHVRREAAGIAHDECSELASLDVPPLLKAAAVNYFGALEAFAGPATGVFRIGYADLAARFAEVAGALGADNCASRWDGTVNAKAHDPSSVVPYRPVDPIRIAAFRREHGELSRVAEERYVKFLMATGGRTEQGGRLAR